jgi:hypothetical protein
MVSCGRELLLPVRCEQRGTKPCRARRHANAREWELRPLGNFAIDAGGDLYLSALYFAFFMITDPPTSPPKPRDQLVNGALVALVSYLVFELVGAVYFLLAGLLVANVFEAWRRHRRA